MTTLYVLLCENKRYYIGKTDRPLQQRIKEHFTNNGSEWTQKYKPIKVIQTINNIDDFDEDKYTKVYMKEYGINNVRGGSYSQIILPEYSRMALEKELCNASNLCFRCNREGHYVLDCYATTKADGSLIEESDDSDSWETVSDSDDCYCCEYCNKEFDTESDAEKHEKKCKSTLKNNKQSCFRCGRPGHYSNECYANTNINGKKLYY